MSYIYSRGLVAEYLEDSYSDTELFAQLKLNHMHKPSLWHDKTMEHSHLSRFGMTCEVLTEILGEALLMWSQEDSRAKTYPQLEKGKELLDCEADYGKNLSELLAKYDPEKCLWKTVQCSLLEDSELFSEIWPRWGLMQNGAAYQLETVALGMRETGFGYLLPTLNTTGLDGGSNSRRAWKNRMLPTIKRQDMRHAVSRHINPKSDHWESNLGEVLVALTGLKKWSPRFAEWMMGWPIGSTELQPLETGKYQEWQRQHGDCLEANK